MNDRIKQLAEQAGMEDYPVRGINTLYGDKEIQKFAELIVRGCAMKANATALDLRNYPDLDGRKYVGDCILKCFGVE